jgi:hypothetical protein
MHNFDPFIFISKKYQMVKFRIGWDFWSLLIKLFGHTAKELLQTANLEPDPLWSKCSIPTYSNFTPGLNFTPRGELGLQGWNLYPRGNVHPFFTLRGEHSLLFRRKRGDQRISPQGITSPLGDEIHPWGTTSPLESKFAPRGEVENWTLVFFKLPPYTLA